MNVRRGLHASHGGLAMAELPLEGVGSCEIRPTLLSRLPSCRGRACTAWRCPGTLFVACVPGLGKRHVHCSGRPQPTHRPALFSLQCGT